MVGISKDAGIKSTFKKAELPEGGGTDGGTGQRKGKQATGARPEKSSPGDTERGAEVGKGQVERCHMSQDVT